MGKSKKSLVLVSGGLDSAVTASIAKASSLELYFLHLNYGQRTEDKELKAFKNLKEFFDVKDCLITDISYLKDIGGSALTDEAIEVPLDEIDTENEDENKKVPITYVPFRNAHLLSIAVSWAEVIGAEDIYIGAVEEDSSGYPDCRREFFDAYETAANLGTKPDTKINLITPLIEMSKGEIVKEGLKLGTPFELTWSCYKNSLKACGHCDSCILRLKGFKEADTEDPIEYE